MKALITSVVLAATSMVSPAFAGLHDFTPSNARPSSPTIARSTVIPSSVYGSCYNTKDRSRVCYMQIQKGIYFAAIYDVDTPQYPIAMTVNCQSGRWGGYGDSLNQTQALAWAKGLCASIDS
jgi:hypothetical protein